ncbi:MAG: hypothetical protein ACRDOL_16130 [Streptosporangiaceae bacterium]
MARIVCVHGVGSQLRGEQSLLTDWYPALCDGLARAKTASVTRDEVAMAFYGDLFRPSGEWLAAGDPTYTAADVESGWEQDLLYDWWQAAAANDDRVAPPDADTLARAPQSVQAALRQLARSRFFAGIALRSLIFDLKQTRLYLHDSTLRVAAQARVAEQIDINTRVVVAHSLGTVVAYEAMCAHPTHRIQAFITLGSPLGVPNLVFDRLIPVPVRGQGKWPGDAELKWTNLADVGDVVALEKDLRPRFGEGVRNAIVNNGAHAHDATSYLTDRLTGTAIAEALP